MATLHLARIVYASAMFPEVVRTELDTLLSLWRRLNARRGITGVLLYDRGAMFQVIEGFPEDTAALFGAIERDPRHHTVVKLIDEPITARSFGEWSMGHARVSATELAGAVALRPFLDPAVRYSHCDEAMARAVIATLAEGPWRRLIG